MKKYFTLFILILCALCSSEELKAQKKRGKKNTAGGKELFIPQTAPKEKQGPFISPVRKVLNKLNFSIEAGTGFFSHSQDLSDLVVVSTNNPEFSIYAFPIADARSGGPFDAATNWFNDSRQVSFDQIHDNDIAVSTDTLAVQFENQGNYTPLTFKLSFSIKKTDKTHLKTHG